MIALRLLMLLAAVAVCYLLFLHVGPAPTPVDSAGTGLPNSASQTEHSEYKQAMDKAHAAVRQMQAQRAEADAP
jgi:hypothetical protein